MDEYTLILSYLKSLAELSGAPVEAKPHGRGIEVTSESEDSLREFIARSQIGLLKPRWKQVESTRES
jgi:hypothetical protein